MSALGSFHAESEIGISKTIAFVKSAAAAYVTTSSRIELRAWNSFYCNSMLSVRIRAHPSWITSSRPVFVSN